MIKTDKFKFLVPMALALSLAACGGSTSEEDGANAEPAAEANIASATPDITVGSDYDFVMKMSEDLVFRKKIGTSVGKVIEITDFGYYFLDKEAWQSGGKLGVINDQTMGTDGKIVCHISAEDGDAFMKNTDRRILDVKGRIESFSTAGGLSLNPCVIKEKS